VYDDSREARSVAGRRPALAKIPNRLIVVMEDKPAIRPALLVCSLDQGEKFAVER
jgi:hypothetical protein